MSQRINDLEPPIWNAIGRLLIEDMLRIETILKYRVVHDNIQEEGKRLLERIRVQNELRFNAPSTGALERMFVGKKAAECSDERLFFTYTKPFSFQGIDKRFGW
jgi:hypothetical protein